jgi:hypothetical protein
MDPQMMAAFFAFYQQMQAQQQVPPPPVVQAPPPVVRNFALTPASQHADPLDFDIPADVKVFNKATEPLADKYDLSSGGLKGYLDGIWQRACTSQMEDVLSVLDSHGVLRSLITEYGM